MSRPRQRGVAAAGMATISVGALLAAGHGLSVRSAEAASEAPAPLRLAKALPEWLAPGVRLRVEGWAGEEEVVRLSVDGRLGARGRAGRLGRFSLSFRTPMRSGVHRLALVTARRRTVLPPLLVRPVVVAAVGDVNLGDRVGSSIGSYGANYPWTSAAPLLRSADVAIANLECAISTRGTPEPKKYTFRGDPSSVAGLAAAGLDVVSVANNHSLDFGVDGFLDTLRHLRRGGIEPVGGGRNLSAARRSVVREVGGLSIAFLAYSDVRPWGFDATSSKPGAAPANLELAADVRRARRAADLVVVYFHWGTELASAPDGRQRTFAAAALEAGATVVLGAHPHVLQPIERSGARVVVWSLGNFVFAANSAGTTATGVFTIGLDARGVRWTELVPATIDGVRPLLDQRRAEQTLRRLAQARSL